MRFNITFSEFISTFRLDGGIFWTSEQHINVFMGQLLVSRFTADVDGCRLLSDSLLIILTVARRSTSSHISVLRTISGLNGMMPVNSKPALISLGISDSSSVLQIKLVSSDVVKGCWKKRIYKFKSMNSKAELFLCSLKKVPPIRILNESATVVKHFVEDNFLKFANIS